MGHGASTGTAKDRDEFRRKLGRKNAAPLWEEMARLIPPGPKTRCIPALWEYEELRPLLMEAGSLITAQEAERRVLMLKNPGLGGESQITQSLYAGLQLVMPGEFTCTHRHTASALRFIIEGSGAYTAVNGERAAMRPGDFIVTPSWTYHDHGNPSQEPVVWLDGLDVPIVNLFDTSFSEQHPQGAQPRRVDQSGSPAFRYPYDRAREQLEGKYRSGILDARHGVELEYTDPATGGPPIPAIAAFLQMFPAGFRGGKHRATDATVCCVVEGRGRSRIGDVSLDWREHDIFVIPSWTFAAHESDGGAVVFSFSDRPAQRAFGIWREDF